MSDVVLVSSHAIQLRSQSRALALCGGVAAVATAGGYSTVLAGQTASQFALLSMVVFGGCFAGLSTLWSP